MIVPIADGEAEHIVAARLLVETGSLCAFRSDTGRREAAAAEMRASVNRQRDLAASAGSAAFTAEDADFHSVVVRYGANPLLAAFYVGLRDRQRRMAHVRSAGIRCRSTESSPIMPNLRVSSSTGMSRSSTRCFAAICVRFII